MILDNQTMYANGQAITALGDTASTNSYDHGPGNSGVGAGDLWLVARTGNAVTSGGAATVQVVLQDAADNATFVDVSVLTPALALAALGANKTIAIARMPGNVRRYSRIVFRVGTAALTAGTFSAFPVLDTDLQQYLTSGFKIGP